MHVAARATAAPEMTGYMMNYIAMRGSARGEVATLIAIKKIAKFRTTGAHGDMVIVRLHSRFEEINLSCSIVVLS